MLSPIQHLNHRPSPRRHGLSLVELMVGITVGLFLIGGALSLFVSNIQNSRRLLVEARMNQDLRAAADLITRDLRRAGYWGNAVQGTIASGTGTTTTANPYAAVAPSAAASTITYNYSQDATENNTLDDNEQFGFRLQNNVIQMRTAANTSWQAVTDPNVLEVLELKIDDSGSTTIGMGSICSTTVLPGAANYPSITLRQYTLTITAQAPGDSTIKRQLRTNVKVRNDAYAGGCP